MYFKCDFINKTSDALTAGQCLRVFHGSNLQLTRTLNLGIYTFLNVNNCQPNKLSNLVASNANDCAISTNLKCGNPTARQGYQI